MGDSINGSILTFTRDAEFIHRRARARRDAGEDFDALRLYRRASAEAPDNLEYRIDVAEMLNGMGCVRSSYDIINSLINSGAVSNSAIRSGRVDGSVLFGQACNLSSLGFPAAALDVLALARRYPHNAEDADEMNDLHTRLLAGELLSGGHRLELRLIRRLERCAARNDARHAVAAARRYLRFHGKSSLAHAAMAWAYMLRGDQPASMEHLVQALAMKQQNPWVLSIAARILTGGDRGQAQPALTSAYQLSTEPECDAQLLRQAVALGMDSLVLDISARMLEMHKHDPRATAFHAAALINTGSPARMALAELRRSLEVHPGDVTLEHYINLINHPAEPGAPLRYPDREMLEQWARTVAAMRMRLMTAPGSDEELMADSKVMRLLEWGLNYIDEEISASSAALLTHIGGELAQATLWRFLASYELPDSCRYSALALMAAADFPMPRLIFLGGRLRRLAPPAMCRMMLHDEPRADVKLAARRLRRYPTAIITLRAMLFFARDAVQGDLHFMTNALECACRFHYGETLNLRGIARSRELDCVRFTNAVHALVHAVNHQEE